MVACLALDTCRKHFLSVGPRSACSGSLVVRCSRDRVQHGRGSAQQIGDNAAGWEVEENAPAGSERGREGGTAEACRLSDARARRARVVCGSVRGDDAFSTRIHLLMPARGASYTPADSRPTHHRGRLRIHASLHACANLPIILTQGTFPLMSLRPELWNHASSEASGSGIAVIWPLSVP